MNNINIKALNEQRAAAIQRMNELVSALETKGENGTVETRAFTDEELTEFNNLKGEVTKLTATINSVSETRALDISKTPENAETSVEELEERAFIDYLRSGKPMELETRSDSNWTPAANGAAIPTSIANKIIEKVVELSPVFAMSTKYNVGGTLTIPYYDETDGSITVEYTDEFTDGTGTSGKLSSITLGGFLARAISKVSKSLINNSAFDILSYVIGKVAESVAKWIDEQLLVGTPGKIEGLSGAKQVVTAAAQNAITSDELIDLQDKVPDAFQPNAVWIMSRKTRSAIRKLKDGDGNYILNKDATTKWGYSLFGRPVYVADKMPDMAAGKAAVYYGDFSGLAVKISENVNIEVLREMYAQQHAYGVVAFLEMDAKIENDQKISVLKMKA